MKFRTEINIGRSKVSLRTGMPLAFLGSCFADNIGARMRNTLWDAINPLGVLFNPLSIANNIELALLSDNRIGEYEASIFNNRHLWHTWLGDSSFSSLSKDDVLSKLLTSADDLHRRICGSNILFVTFGTSFCYFLENQHIAANCHKQPQSLFKRRRINCNEITQIWRPLLSALKEKYPELQIVFTVSPVRHVRDGLHENQLSKATLLLAIDELCHNFDWCEYFPAYEILNDDLRDYRFYASDLAHPSDEAVEYIWEKFKDTFLDSDGLAFIKEGESISKRMAHRPILASTDEISSFKMETDCKHADFKLKYPFAL